MTESEYNVIQNRLRNKRKATNYVGNKKEAYQQGVEASMSIIKEIYEKGKVQVN